MLKPEQFKHLSTYLIAKEAARRGVKVKRLITKGVYAKKSFLELKYGSKTEYIIGQRTSKTDVIAYWLQKNKYYAKLFLKNAGISVSAGEVFDPKDPDEVVKYANKIGYPLVLKRTDGTHGDDVYVNLTNETELLDKLKHFTVPVLLEEMSVGTEFRLFATRQRFVAATKRIPANVVGDSVNSVEDLVNIKNTDPRRSDGYSSALIKIKIDEEAVRTLAKQNISLSSVPKVGERVFLRENSNLSTGGDSIDVTDLVHPEVKQLAVKTVKAIPGLAYAGIDFLTKRDIGLKPTKGSYVIIEVNDSPMISMHHYPYEGKERDAAGAILDILFPATKNR